MAKNCIFCGEPLKGVRAEEHCVPRWLMEHLGITDDDLLLGVAQTADDQILKSRQHPAGNFVEGRVCGDCNNGWMNELEKAAKPILKQLTNAEVSLLGLSEPNRIAVAKWAAKTAYVVNYASPLQKLADPTHLRYMKENAGAAPPRVGVFALQSPIAVGFLEIERNHWWHITDSPKPNSTMPGSYKIALQFRHLMLLTAYWPDPDTDFVIAAGVHFPLWPVRQIYFSCVPPEPMKTTGSAAQLDMFCRTLAVIDLKMGI